MADIDLAPLVPRARDPLDYVVVVKEDAPEAMGLIPIDDFLAGRGVSLWVAAGNGSADASVGIALSATGTSTAANWAATRRHTRMRRREWLVTVAATTAVAGVRGASMQWTVGAGAAGLGGFHIAIRWAPATGVANASHRAFAGMRGNNAAPTDVNPSTLVNICGMGYDAADANIQFMHNDNTGTATKINLGAAFPKPTADRTAVYEITLTAPPGTVQSVRYHVVDLVSGAEATGTVTTDLPTTTQALTPYAYTSVGGVSAVTGLAVNMICVKADAQ